MSKDRANRRADAARQILDHLGSSETAAEDAVEVIGVFASSLPKLRASANVSTTFGHDVYVEIAAALSAAVEMRGRLVRAHHMLEEARIDLRLPRMMTLPGNDKPSNPNACLTGSPPAGAPAG